ncbi:MAG: sigma-54 dependent transcriptional regulator [Bacteroidales bacterium]|nr:sigma-54 dependent transcriptional regulator [Bacteroidales bacterium]MCM1148291.1 sigma-54 dependent transcriptional regulator [Bacteroidales bacterium]MCM1206495.1 sigma-54 dependent transcriptional regulator [Bacillota bacterium]MCM1510381.1 sigma-54 dependent transcriptional regulator [Clostridium sp.]
MEQRLLQQIKQRYGVVGNCEQLNHALDICLQVAPTDLSVLIIGESGVGKEVLPRIIHDNSPRKREKYLAINCGSIPEGTIDSELFGHEKGAYTGAVDEGDGYFGIANKGTLFLDEVGELPLATQARLLRVLETGEYIRVGGTEVLKTDVRIVAATNVNMVKAISEGKFRRDLYYRLNSIPVRMPALRERGNDIISLFRLFALQMVEKYKMPRLDLTEDAKHLLLKYKWPGNVRQLKNVTEQISLLSEDRMITAEQLLKFIPDDEESMAVATYSTTASGESHSYEQERQLLFNFLVELQNSVQRLNGEVQELQKQVIALGGQPAAMSHPVLSLPPATPQIASPAYEVADSEEIKSESHDMTESLNVGENERELLKKALQRCGGNRKNAAKELGISDRTLYRRLKQLNLE